jgi:hypothetical protein
MVRVGVIEHLAFMASRAFCLDDAIKLAAFANR